jgi:hypothetical protein
MARSRSRELFERAASKATPPFKRVYLDTQPLRKVNWPNASKQLDICMYLARLMGIEIYIPEPVRFERKEQWIRETLSKVQAASTSVQSLRRTLKSLDETLSVQFQVPTEGEMRTVYETTEQAALDKFNIRFSPYGTLRLDEVFRMAVARDFTFEQKGDGVVGLQDCAILISVLDHLSANPTQAAFVSGDGVFERLPTLSVNYKVDLSLVPSIDALEKTLDDAHGKAFSAEFGEWWANETKSIRETVTAHFSQIAVFLETTIEPAQIDGLFAGKILSRSSPTVEHVTLVRPDVTGEDRESIPFSCDLVVAYSAVVERASLPTLDLLTNLIAWGGRHESATSSMQPRLQQIKETRTVTVELEGKVSPDYANITLIAARIKD